jgi:hypothetical protein
LTPTSSGKTYNAGVQFKSFGKRCNFNAILSSGVLSIKLNDVLLIALQVNVHLNGKHKFINDGPPQ